MQDIVSPLQSISYTNKDFQKIYPELLDLVKQLTNKWDPSISNESDPGVVLIKLNALIADKCNYNIDKNVLECFPLSVTQIKNARQLFEQLGYYMRWYNSATTYVSLKWIGNILEDVYFPIPPFTMITDENKTVVYTITGYTPTIASQNFNIGTVNLPGNGKTINVKVIQGIAVKYDINGDTIITPQHLDSDHRIYFNFSNIAENGIFITNTGNVTNYQSWIKKDNLLVEELGNTYYKFGVSADGSTCYLEFPEDYDVIMKDGIEITYIRSDGSYGNIQSQQLNNFYSDLSVTASDNQSMVLNAQNVQLVNYFPSYDGKDYESIDEAYKNYKRVVGTFDTLITLRDYLNYIITNDLASNGFVCDRNNDLQNSYKIMKYTNGTNNLSTVIDESNGFPTMTAFSLKLYLTKYFQDVSTTQNYNNSFSLLSSSQLDNVKDYLSDVKAIQHDYEPILPSTDTRSHFCLFKNKYPINCTIIPTYTLSVSQQTEVKNKIRLALYQFLNSNEIEFGDYIKQDYVYKIISEADPRIKTVILDSISYNTYAVYLDSETGQYKEILISGDIKDSCNVELKDSLDEDITSYSINEFNSDTFIAKVINENIYSYEQIIFTYSSGWLLDGNSVTLSNYGITLSAGASPSSGDKIIIQVSKQTQFRDEILVKSILAGVTPFFVQEEKVDYRLDQSKNASYNLSYNNIKTITPSVNISLSNSQNQYTLRNGEVIQLYAPNLLQKTQYNNYVKFECSLTTTIPANSYYQLTENDIIIFYWKSSASSAKYQYAAYSEGCIICPTFNLSSTDQTTSNLSDLQTDIAGMSVPKILTSVDQELSTEQSQLVAILTSSDNILSSNKEIGYYVINSVDVTTSMQCYWILNTTTVSNGIEVYTLFDIGQTERVLQSGEYFFYTDNEMTQFVSLGGGTRITRQTSTDSMVVRAIEISDITLNGISALQSYWYSPNYTISVEEDQFINLQAGYKLKVQSKSASTWTLNISSTPVDLSNYYVYYTGISTDSEEEQLPEFNFTSVANWSARSMLNINISSSVEQILLSGQSITIVDTNNVSTTINGADLTGTPPVSLYYPVAFRSNESVQASGLNVINTVFYTSDLDVYYLDLYVYTKQLTRSNIVTYVGDNCSILIPASQSSSSTSNPPIFTLPEGHYLIPVTISDIGDNVYARIKLTDLTTTTSSYLSPIYSSDVKLSKNTLYPINLNINVANHNYSLIIDLIDNSSSAVTASSNLSFLFTNPLRYEASNQFNKIIYLIKMFDTQNIFNYTFVNSDDLIIRDPLKSDSFLNANHIFNKFTICQLDTSSLSNLKVQ